MKISTLKRDRIVDTVGWVLATWFGAGCAPKAPGTVGSFFSLPLILVGMVFGLRTFLAMVLILFIVGWWATHIVLRSQNATDPGFVVIDETVGQMMTFALVINSPIAWYIPILGFALFRFFDIIKVWPASFFDKFIHNAFGVMMDDVMAGIYAGLVLYGLTFLF